jgi:hypothetical protein
VHTRVLPLPQHESPAPPQESPPDRQAPPVQVPPPKSLGHAVSAAMQVGVPFPEELQQPLPAQMLFGQHGLSVSPQRMQVELPPLVEHMVCSALQTLP